MMRPAMAGMATPKEIDTYWCIDMVFDAHELLDLQEEANRPEE